MSRFRPLSFAEYQSSGASPVHSFPFLVHYSEPIHHQEQGNLQGEDQIVILQETSSVHSVSQLLARSSSTGVVQEGPETNEPGRAKSVPGADVAAGWPRRRETLTLTPEKGS